MRKASEYRQHGDECRQLAMKMESGEQREQLLAMARHWDRLAADRTELIRHHPELAIDDELEDSANPERG